MSRIYIRLLAAAAFSIALIGATFSIAGLAKLFAGAAASVAMMAAALEFAKLVATGFLYRYWGHIPRAMRSYMTFAVATLMLITSVGIYGFLSSAYQVSSIGLKAQEIKIAGLVAENERVLAQIAERQQFIESIPNSRISKKFEFQKTYAPEIAKLREESNAILTAIEAEKTAMLKTHVEIGPAMYLAEALGLPIDTVVRWLILLFVAVFDPLAVCLVFCLNLAIRLREKYRGNEVKISAHSVTTPVDHRFKKAG